MVVFSLEMVMIAARSGRLEEELSLFGSARVEMADKIEASD